MIILITGDNYYRLRNDRPGVVDAMPFVAILGLWTLLAPYAFEVGSAALLWSNVLAGLQGAIIGGYVATTERRLRAEAPTPD